MKLSDAQIMKAMQYLGLVQGDFHAVQQAPTFEEAQARLAALKERVKKQFRKVALELHPDRTNNDPAKTDDFKLVSAAVDDLEKLAIMRPQPRPQIRIVFRSWGSGFSSTASTTTTSYYGGFGF